MNLQFTNQAFRALARYIGVFSEAENKKRDGEMEKIAMTAPVVMSESEKVAMTAPVVMSENSENSAMTTPVPIGEGGHPRDCIMKFLLPSKYKTIEDAPVPTNPAVKLEMVVEGRCDAVLTYAGAVRFSTAREKATELLKMLERDGIEPKGSYTVHGYNPPFTLPMFKRTEIHIPVDAASYEQM